MKIIVLKSNFLEALSAVERAIGSGSNLPVLKNFLLRSEGSKITAVSTNLELAITYTFSGKVVENGEAVIPFSVLYSIVRNINSERITIELKNKKVVVTTDNYEATIQGYDSKEYPIIPNLHDRVPKITMTAGNLARALENTIIATQFSEIRPEISGIFAKIDSGAVFFVGTDSFRLAEKKIEDARCSEESSDVKAIIPLRTAEEVIRIMAAQGESGVCIQFDSTQVLFKTENVEIISRLIDGNFPEYKPIIPTQTNIEVTVSRHEFVNAVKLTSAFSGKMNDIAFSVGENGKHIELSSSDAATGENTYKVPAKVKGDKISLVFNWKYLLEGAKVFSGEEITLGINAPEKPVKIKSAGDPSLVYVVMPIKN